MPARSPEIAGRYFSKGKSWLCGFMSGYQPRIPRLNIEMSAVGQPIAIRRLIHQAKDTFIPTGGESLPIVEDRRTKTKDDWLALGTTWRQLEDTVHRHTHTHTYIYIYKSLN